MPRPVPGAELCEQTDMFAGYWKKGAWNETNREQALVCMEQAVNGWKNLAYDLARQVHYANRAAPSETKTIGADIISEIKAWQPPPPDKKSDLIRRLRKEQVGAKKPIAGLEGFPPILIQMDAAIRLVGELCGEAADMLEAAPSATQRITCEHGVVGYCEPCALRDPGEVGEVTEDMVNRFLSWPLPDSVCSDPCATKRGYPHRIGTNLLTADEARQMLEHVLLERRVRNGFRNPERRGGSSDGGTDK